ncbi:MULTISPECIES: hypothetical protein [Pirellulaceae]|nr:MULTISPECIES: hypothetical protein [Pirellulaceae]
MRSSQIQSEIQRLLEANQPRTFPFFEALKGADTRVVLSEDFLDAFYLRYQAAMHATRVMVYQLPHLDEISLRVKKCRVIADDDLNPHGDTHHAQLRDTWSILLGRPPRATDELFGAVHELPQHLDERTSRFVLFVANEYPKSLGPWVVIEGLADDWINSLCCSLRPHYPMIDATRYFVHNLASGVEKEHAQAASELFLEVAARKPELTEEGLAAATRMTKVLREFWAGCDELLDTCLASVRQA